MWRGAKLKVTPEAVSPITTAEYPVPAPRPLNSRLDTHKLQTTFGVTLPAWQVGVDAILDQLNQIQNREQLRQASVRLAQVDANLLGVTVNMTPKRGGKSYGYGYGYPAYGYPYGGGYDPGAAAAAGIIGLATGAMGIDAGEVAGLPVEPEGISPQELADRKGYDLMPEQGYRPVNKYLPPRARRDAVSCRAALDAIKWMAWADSIPFRAAYAAAESFVNRTMPNASPERSSSAPTARSSWSAPGAAPKHG